VRKEQPGVAQDIGEVSFAFKSYVIVGRSKKRLVVVVDPDVVGGAKVAVLPKHCARIVTVAEGSHEGLPCEVLSLERV
jgi:hypothetical protein